MRYGDKCEEKDVKMKNVNPGVMNLINNANFLLNVGLNTQLLIIKTPNFRV